MLQLQPDRWGISSLWRPSIILVALYSLLLQITLPTVLWESRTPLQIRILADFFVSSKISGSLYLFSRVSRYFRVTTVKRANLKTLENILHLSLESVQINWWPSLVFYQNHSLQTVLISFSSSSYLCALRSGWISLPPSSTVHQRKANGANNLINFGEIARLGTLASKNGALTCWH